MLLLLTSFIAGLLTALAPCVLPLLPIIIGGSVSGDTRDKRRPIIIAVSLAASLFAFTLLLKATSLLINIPPRSINYLSGAIIIILGIFTLMPTVYATIIARLGLEHGAQKALSTGQNSKSSLAGPIITGASLGPVFSSCSPVYAYILATILPVNFGQAMAYISSYILGLSLIMLVIGFYGQSFIGRIKFAANPKGWFQRTIAAVFIIVGLLIFTGVDKRFQTWVSVHTPFKFDALSSKLLPKSENQIKSDRGYFNVDAFPVPEFTGLTSWMNSDPLAMKDLRGKVVLVDFWTYSCINCIRNNPYLIKWYEQYKNQGFVIVGVHAPEFAFEKVPANVAKAIKDQKITYPVALDNDFGTWNAFNNRSWPASYLIDAEGQVRRIHEGEGEYAEEEDAIRELLREKGAKIDANKTTTGSEALLISGSQSPETYLGSRRASNFLGSPALAAAPTSTFTAASELKVNNWTLSGKWDVTAEKIIARGDTRLQFRISAKEVYVVGGSAAPAMMTVNLNGQPISQTGFAGDDVQNSRVNVSAPRPFKLVKYPKLKSGDILELVVPDGVELNAFTFGG